MSPEIACSHESKHLRQLTLCLCIIHFVASQVHQHHTPEVTYPSYGYKRPRQIDFTTLIFNVTAYQILGFLLTRLLTEFCNASSHWIQLQYWCSCVNKLSLRNAIYPLSPLHINWLHILALFTSSQNALFPTVQAISLWKLYLRTTGQINASYRGGNGAIIMYR